MALDIISLCPFPAGTVLWEDAPGQQTLTVCVKGTFQLVPGGEVTLAPRQEPLTREQHWENNLLASLYAPGDFAPVKPKVDLLLVGRAHAPEGAPVASLEVRFSVGEWSKSLRVLGERRYRPGQVGLEPSDMAPFLEMPLRFERAAIGPNNPVGHDPSGARSAGALASPTIETLEPRAFPAFGPIAPSWRSRRILVEESCLTWAYGVAAPGRSGLGPPPKKVDLTFFNAAPRDQQVDLLRPGTTITLEGLSAGRRVLTTTTPRVKPQAFLVSALTGKAEEIGLRCDTLWIDADRGLLTLTWRGLTEARSKDEQRLGRLVVAADPEGRKLRWEAVERILREGSEGGLNELDPMARRYDAVKNSSSDEGYLPSPAVEEEIHDEDSVTHSENTGPFPIEDSESTHDSKAPKPPKGDGVLPFDPTATPVLPPPSVRSAPPPPPERHEWDNDRTGEISSWAARRPATPFETLAARAEPRTEPPPPPPASSPAFASPPVPPAPQSEPTTSSKPLAEAQTDESIRVASGPDEAELEDLARARYYEKKPAIVNEETVDATAFDATAKPPVPPALLMPRQESIAPEAVDEGWSFAASEAAAVLPKATEEAEEPPFSAEAISLATYAELTFELGVKGADRPSLLEKRGLDDPKWTLVDEHWTRELGEHNERGDRELLHVYDAAYVAAQERAKKPLTVRDYAKILVGVERGEVGKVLGELELQLSDLMRIQRVWTKRISDTPQLAAELNKAVEAARKTKA